MLIPEAGVHQTSERYFFTPSSLARELFYYPTRCGHYFCDRRYSFSYRSEIAMEGDHNRNIMLFLVQDGAMELELAGVPVLAAAGQVVLFDCQEPYQYAASDGLEFTWLLFNGLNVRAFYRRILQAHGGRQCFAPDAVTPVAQALGTLLEGCAADERPSEAACSQLLHRLLCLLLLGEGERTSDGSDRIAQAIRFMNRHLFEPIGVQEVAAAVSLSPSHFSRQFKARTGYSPYEYIVLRRIDKAKYMLASTALSVKEIAYATGYNSEENFSHSFQKHVGISPGLFRKYPV
ncbi:AraC family transcriptional regulator [Agathobaculum sp. Marseille-P7918]|uniref:AraC family transcriptional regulator n=1 Tax=Agathobaculum sp. Marseille-P7918 TaxID=2479843 RepID=UPI000F633922|nr:AraC family transcriptional regulator [Agathobaculum sp. Marseille-P7918]